MVKINSNGAIFFSLVKGSHQNNSNISTFFLH